MSTTEQLQPTPSPVPPMQGALTTRINALPGWARWSLAATVGVFVLSFVQEVSGTSLLTAESTSRAMVRWAIPILLAGLGGLFAERSGVVNIGLEGMMILGTWFGAWGALNWGPWGGLIAGFVGGALGGVLHAIATVTFGVDQVVSGVAINILAPGLARYMSERVFSGMTGGSVSQSPRVNGFDKFTVPVIADVLGTIRDWDVFLISDMAGLLRGFVASVSIFTVLALLCVPFTAWLLWRTRFGLRLRICGENPWAGESLGVRVFGHKYIAVAISGGLAGLAGAYIVLELSGLYRGGQTTGRGFIGLAALIFGNWRPWGVLAGAMLFSYPFGLALVDFDAQRSGVATRALLLVIAICLYATAVWLWFAQRRDDKRREQMLASTSTGYSSPTASWMNMLGALGRAPSGRLSALAAILATISLIWYLATDRAAAWLPNTMPYVLVLLVLVFAAQRLRPPAAAGIPYRRGEH